MLKQIDSTIPLPKYYQIGESIREQITAGNFRPGEKIPTCRELSEYFKATLVTVSNAVRRLENDGHIRRIRGSGMFVSVPDTAANAKKAVDGIKKVGLAMHARGDLNQKLVETLIHDLGKHDIYTLPLPSILPNTSFCLGEKCLKNNIATGLDSLVIEGTRHTPYKMLLKYQSDLRQLNFLIHYNSIIDFPDANIIVFDYAKAGRLAAEHMIKAGREKFIFLTYAKLPESERKRNGCRSDIECNDMAVLNGMKTVLLEAGLPESSITIIRDAHPLSKKRNTTDFTTLLKQGPLGIFALGDFRTVQIYKAATKMGLDFKRNLSIVGCYNTSWADVLHPTLTSIAVNESEIARLAADCIINRKTGQRMIVEPELIVRET